jgi:hypothetical protein
MGLLCELARLDGDFSAITKVNDLFKYFWYHFSFLG